MASKPASPPTNGATTPDYKVTLYGSCPGCSQFSGKIEWTSNSVRALRDRFHRESPSGFCAECRREFPLTWAQVRLRGRMIREGEISRVLLADDPTQAGS